METNRAITLTIHGPCKFDMSSCGIANETPATAIAGPYFDHPVPARKRAHQPERYQNAEGRQNSSCHRAQRNLAETGDFRESDDRCAQRAEGHGRGIRDQRQAWKLAAV